MDGRYLACFGCFEAVVEEVMSGHFCEVKGGHGGYGVDERWRLLNGQGEGGNVCCEGEWDTRRHRSRVFVFCAWLVSSVDPRVITATESRGRGTLHYISKPVSPW